MSHSDQSSGREDKLIDIEKVFADKNPKLLKIIPHFLIQYLKKITHQDEINEFIVKNREITGVEFAKKVLELFGISIRVNGLEKIPQNDRYVFASNHPLGGLDGIAFIVAVSERFEDLKFPVNDILLNIEGLKDIFIPVNKHGGHSREAVNKIEQAFASESHILYFPAGLVSRKIKGQITDLEWKNSFMKKAIACQRSIVPVHISGCNRPFFYNLANLRRNLGIKSNIEMLYLVDEMYNIQTKEIVINFGKPVTHQELKSEFTVNQWVTRIRQKTYDLANQDQ